MNKSEEPEFRAGDYVNYATLVAGSLHFGSGYIDQVSEIEGELELTMSLDGRGHRLVLETGRDKIFHADPAPTEQSSSSV